MKPEDTKFEKFLIAVKDHPLLSIVMMIGIVIIAIGQFTQAVDSIRTSIFRKEGGSHTPTPLPTVTPGRPAIPSQIDRTLEPISTPMLKPTISLKPTFTPMPQPTRTPKPTSTPMPQPTSTPKLTSIPIHPKPTKTPIPSPTPAPTRAPTRTPTLKPTRTPQPPTPTPAPLTQEPSFQILGVHLYDEAGHLIPPNNEGKYTVRVNAPVKLMIDVSNVSAHPVGITWTSGQGKLLPVIDSQINTYIATKEGGDYLVIIVWDKETGEEIQYALAMDVTK